MRVAPVRRVFRQTPAEQSPPETNRWMERHPVWFGLIVGASVGATWGALPAAMDASQSVPAARR
jgi:hypothetical protein